MINIGDFNRFSALEDYGRKAKGTICISGISESRSAAVAGLLSNTRKSQALIITENYQKAIKMAEDLENFTKDKVYVFPLESEVHMPYTAKSQEDLIEKLKIMNALAEEERCVIVASYSSLEEQLLAKSTFIALTENFKTSQIVDLEEIKIRLVHMGYERREYVEAKGQFAIRGGIIDVFPPNALDPFRIELFDVEVDSIRNFDVISQRSKSNLENVKIGPFIEKPDNLIEDGQSEGLLDYLKEDGIIILDDPDRFGEDFDLNLSLENIAKKNLATFVFLPFLKNIRVKGRLEGLLSLTSKQGMAFNGRMDFLEEEIKKLAKLDYKTIITCSTIERSHNMRDFLARFPQGEKVEVHLGQLSSGMEFPEEKLAIISDRDVFLRIKKPKYKKPEDKNKRAIKAFTDIKKGDYIVHESHGIGQFKGVVQLDVDGLKKDYIKIDYLGEDVLYIPVDQMELVQKYMGAEGARPKLNKLTGGEWERTKARVKAAVQDVAQELLELSAARSLEKGYEFSKDSPWQKEFEDMFPFEETEDQLRSIKEIKEDMERPVPMDRLLCGDVGYGKTEVAARALFKCLTDGKQAAVLVPTTLLANQHYNTFLERFESFPITVEMLSRFKNSREQKEIIKKLETGEVDLVIGTHRLLSKDVKFKDLGLLVIDEEQRFGVKHKEVIKEIRKNIDVLALSATPIPRTLHMSLVGIRDMSLIEDPPGDRYPVQTYVMEENDEVLKEMIEKELSRGGQVFVVYNRISGIYRVAARIGELVPEARVVVSHGRMDEKIMEDNMFKFVNNQVDVLVSTTIVESGLDIPNANTMIILDADKFGLAQLYQLRGRVGRTNRMAYAYLMYQKDKVLTEVAAKRLRAIKEFTEFGAGFHIAMRDLEIRGAGNLLGLEQHGHMLTIGYELYIKLVEEAIRGLSGSELEGEEEHEVSMELPVSAYISSNYIEEESTKLHMYKRIASINNHEDKNDIVDEFADRFGNIPAETLNLIDVALLRALAKKAGIKRVRTELNKLVLDLDSASKLKPQILGDLSSSYGDRLFIHGGKQAFIRLSGINGSGLEEAVRVLTKLTVQSII